MSLPLPWVERIFQKLTLNFGRDFTSRWEGVPLDEVKSDWAFELRGFQQNPAAIKHGIETTINGKHAVKSVKGAFEKSPLGTASDAV